MKSLILAALLLLNPIAAKADALELEDINLQYKTFWDGGRDSDITDNGLGHFMDKELNLQMNFNVFEYFYWDNTIHSMTDRAPNGDTQFRLVGWNYRLGLHITDYIDFGYNHFSKHFLDYQGPNGFPLENSWELNIHLFRKHNPGRGLL